ncbi:hypothetical protein [Pseudomonas putida]|uniref:hypothetical protein n=1 Tax=Pseudomonas putida TaxID=303 RepID=UPI000462FCAD|nr:hypothetical protein [Pseudomonas putida]
MKLTKFESCSLQSAINLSCASVALGQQLETVSNSRVRAGLGKLAAAMADKASRLLDAKPETNSEKYASGISDLAEEWNALGQRQVAISERNEQLHASGDSEELQKSIAEFLSVEARMMANQAEQLRLTGADISVIKEMTGIDLSVPTDLMPSGAGCAE